MTSKVFDSKLVIYLEGRIDSTNAQSIEREIDELIERNPRDELVLDLENLEYISSAGLRITLKLVKSIKNVKIINASSAVYEIFEMTGFTEFANISKAFRKISIKDAEVIGQGANGKIYRIDDETICKVYLNDDSLPDIERERNLTRKAFVLGVPTVIPYDVVKTEEGYASVFELLNSCSFAKLTTQNPNKLDEYIKMSVELLKKIHSTVVSSEDFPDMKKTVLYWADYLKDYLPEATFTKLIKMINDVPYTNHMLHGDFHFKNVMMQNDEPVIIDMDTICVGNPIFEFASMYNACEGFSYYSRTNVFAFLGIPYEVSSYIFKKQVELYLETSDEEKLNEVFQKAKLIGFVRIARRSIRRGHLNDEMKAKVTKCYLSEIIKLVDELDNLII